MSKPAPAPRSALEAQSGYRKGEETRQRILEAALRAFGKASFRAVTTRRIARLADVSLPTLQYHFGGKEGLYRACADAIVERYRRHTATAAAAAAEALRKDCPPEQARAHLKAVIGALTAFLVGSKEAERASQFVGRELRDPGPAFDILYDNLWRPGIDLTARLIARISGASDRDPAARLRAVLLISSVLAFQPGRSLSLRTMQWASVGPKELALILAALDAQIGALGNG